MERIVFIEGNTIRAEFRRPSFAHEWIEFSESAPDQVAERVRDATIVISNKLSLGEPQLSRCAGKVNRDRRHRIGLHRS
jgi:glycerate dehydrogenase